MALQNNVKAYLKGKHIGVPDEWISACLEWVQSEHPESNMSNNRVILDKVYEQWLHSDLTELATCCLPFGLAQKRSTTVNGDFVLQVNQVRDVGHPAYSQLQKLRRVDNGNVSVSADQQHQPAWEAKPTRMLMMQMTDGTSVVQGMEYRSIPHLNVNLKPGTKVLVSGAIKARRGVLLLTREHITVLGGEIETLLIPNAMENILARALGAEETDEPKQLEELVATQIPPSQASQYYPSQLNGVPSRSQNMSQAARGGQVEGRQVSSHTARGGGGGRGRQQPSSVNRQQNNTMAHPPVSLDDLGDDDFLDDDLEAALNQIETQAGSSTSNYNSNIVKSSVTGSCRTQMTDNKNITNNRMKTNKATFTNQTNMSWQNSELEIDVDDEFFNDDFDDEILLSAEGSVNQSQSIGQTSSSFQQPRNVGSHSLNSLKSPSHISNNRLSVPARESPSYGKQTNTSTVKQSTPVRSSIPQKVQKVSPLTLSSSKKGKMPAKQSRLTSFLSKSSGNQVNNKSSSMDDIEDDFEIGYTIPGDAKSNIMNKENPTVLRDKRPKIMAPNDSITKRVKQEPFTYLFFLPDRPSQTQEYLIKGFIMTLTSKLEQSEGNWKLAAMINDGSASRQVDIDNKILCRLIGMTVEQFNIKKVEARVIPALRAQLSKNVSGCQQKLISLCSLLKLEISPNNLRPRLTEIIPVNSVVASQLSQRSSSGS